MELTVYDFYKKLNKKILFIIFAVSLLAYPILHFSYFKQNANVFYEIHTYQLFTKKTYRDPINRLFLNAVSKDIHQLKKKCDFSQDSLEILVCKITTKKNSLKNLKEDEIIIQIRSLYELYNKQSGIFVDSLIDIGTNFNFYLENTKDFHSENIIERMTIDEKLKEKKKSEIIANLNKEAETQTYLYLNRNIENFELNIVNYIASFMAIIFIYLSINFLILSKRK